MEKENSSLEININLESEELIVVTLSGKITDTSTASNMVNEVTKELTESRNNIIVSLKDIDYINSNGLNSLIALLTKSRTRGGDLTLCDINEKVSKLLLITKLNTVFNIEATVEDALNKTIQTNEN